MILVGGGWKVYLGRLREILFMGTAWASLDWGLAIQRVALLSPLDPPVLQLRG